MDDLDRAAAHQQFLLDLRIANTRGRPSEPPRTHCRYCESQLEQPGQFCDADCRDDFVRLQRNQAQRTHM